MVRTPRPDKCAQLPGRSRDAKELAAHGSRTALACKNKRAISRSEFTKGEEYAVNDLYKNMNLISDKYREETLQRSQQCGL